MKVPRGVYGQVDLDGASTWGPYLRRTVFGCACLALWIGMRIGRAQASGWDGAFPDALSVIGFVAVALAVAIHTGLSWSTHRRFGASRLVPARAPQPGETLPGVLEAGDALARAREVQFELVEMHRSSGLAFISGSWGWGTHVRATTTVSVGSFGVMPGSTRVPVSLPVPTDGGVSRRKRTSLGLSIF